MRYIASTIFFLLIACGSDSKTPEPKHELPAEQPVEDSEVPVEAVPVEATPVENEPASAEGAGDDCVKECVAARQMQATSIETIELDCAKKCSGDEDSP